MSPHDRFTSVIEGLERDGYCIFEDLLDAPTITALAALASDHVDAGRLVQAGTGKGGREDVSVRGDSILWLESDDANQSIATCLAALNDLRSEFNRHLFLNLHDVECHVAAYPPGARYERHIDRFATGDQRRQVSVVLYLNDQWVPADGGALRLYLDGDASGEHLDISPIAGRLVVFESARFWHEVLPSTRQRLSITGWYRTRS